MSCYEFFPRRICEINPNRLHTLTEKGIQILARQKEEKIWHPPDRKLFIHHQERGWYCGGKPWTSTSRGYTRDCSQKPTKKHLAQKLQH